MPLPDPLRWLDWARQIQALAQSGHHYAVNEFDRERFVRLAELAAEIISTYSEYEYEEVCSLFKAQTGYATPRVDVRAAVFREGQLLMVRERSDGNWALPGGWADVGEIPSEAAEREVLEEAGFRVKARKLVGVYDANRFGPLELFHAYKIVFLCDLISGEATPSFETLEVAFFTLDQIPSNFSGERTRTRHIQDAISAWKQADFVTVFD